MRIISQDGTVNVPYENNVIGMVNDPNPRIGDFNPYAIGIIKDNGKELLGIYHSKEEVVEIMELMTLQANDNIIYGNYVTSEFATVEDGVENFKRYSESLCFYMPQEKEEVK